MRLNAIQTTVLTLITVLIAPLVQAHTGQAEVSATAGLVDGFIHPLTGLDHMLVAITAGILVGAACVAYPGMGLESVAVLILIVAGITVAIAAPQVFGYALFGSFLFYQGITHVLEMPVTVALGFYVPGLLFATALLLALGTLLRHVVCCRKPHENTVG
jgi:urease accessory protein